MRKHYFDYLDAHEFYRSLIPLVSEKFDLSHEDVEWLIDFQFKSFAKFLEDPYSTCFSFRGFGSFKLPYYNMVSKACFFYKLFSDTRDLQYYNLSKHFFTYAKSAKLYDLSSSPHSSIVWRRYFQFPPSVRTAKVCIRKGTSFSRFVRDRFEELFPETKRTN